MEELLEVFRVEADTHLEVIEKNLLLLEKNINDLSLVEEVFRSAHSIKGNASFFGFNNIVKLSDIMETRLEKIRSKDELITPGLIDIFLEFNDKLKLMLVDLENESKFDIEDIVRKIKNYKEEVSKVESKTEVDDDFEKLLQEAFEIQKQNGLDIKKVDKKDDFEKRVEEAFKFQNEIVVEEKPLKVRTREEDLNFINVRSKTINNLTNIAGEFLLEKNKFKNDILKNNVNIEMLYNKIEKLTNDLQDQVLKSRIQPLTNIFGKFRRVVRDISKQLGKEIEFKIIGENIELDKTIIDSLSDPLTHLIRNSLDHGIESVEERLEKNKSPKGKITIIAKNLGSSVSIEIIDDGNGIDHEKIAKIALKKGLIDEEKLKYLSNDEKVNLIFLAGFTSKVESTEISGRGVGMDVVRTNIKKIRGSIDVKTKVNEGSRFTLKLPLSLSIISGMKFKMNSHTLILPEIDIEEVVLIQKNDDRYFIKEINNYDYLNVRNEFIPVIKLDEILKTKLNENSNEYIIVTVEDKKFAFNVTKILGNEEILVKPLPKIIVNDVYSGLSITSDGNITAILSCTELVKRSENYHLSTIIKKEDKLKKEEELKEYFNFSIGEQNNFVIPVVFIKKIFLFNEKEIEQIGKHKYYSVENKSYSIFDIRDYKPLGFNSNEGFGKYLILLNTPTDDITIIVENIKGIINISNESSRLINDKGIRKTITYNNILYSELDMRDILETIKAKIPSQKGVDGYEISNI